MPRAYLLCCFRFLFTVVSSMVVDCPSLEACSPRSLWPGWHVTAHNVTAASAGHRAQADGHAEVCKDVWDVARALLVYSVLESAASPSLGLAKAVSTLAWTLKR